MALFVVTRLLFAAAGGRFASEGLSWYWQFLDVNLLRTDLARSLLYLHIQPPLFNLVLGALLKTFGIHRLPLAAHALFATIGLSLTMVLYYVLRRLRCRGWVAIVASMAVVCLPEFFIYENYLFYPYVVAASLAWSVVFLDRYLQTRALVHVTAFFWTVTIAVLTWAFYHPALLLALIVALAIHARVSGWRVRRVLLAAAAAPAAVIGAVCVKNLFLFGFLGTSSQGVLNLSQSTVFALPLEVRLHGVQVGTLSRLAMRTGPFRTVDEEEEDLGREAMSGVPALDQRKKHSGVPNFNNAIYVRASRALESDVLWTLTHYPRTYLRSCLKALSVFFQPTYRYPHVATIQSNLAVLGPGVWLFDRAHGLSQAAAEPASGLFQSVIRTGWLMAALYLLVHLSVPWILFRGGYLSDTPLATAMFYAWLVSLYTVVVGIAVQAGENNRFRFSAEPLVLMLLLYVCSEAARSAVRLGETRAGPRPRES